jgi:flagellum-specific peptidoglycan hydrolase FlgJ
MKIIKILVKTFKTFPQIPILFFGISVVLMMAMLMPRTEPFVPEIEPPPAKYKKIQHTLDVNDIIYAGRFDSACVVKLQGRGRVSKYLWNGAPRSRQWLTYNEWRGKHCKNTAQRKAFRKWKRAEMEDFISFMCMAAVDECRVYKDIPPELIVAQAILESNFNKSRLAVEGNNLFGHKYRGKTPGKFLVAHDDSPTDRFTKYKSVWYSVRNHSKLLMRKYRKRITGTPNLYKWLYALCGGMTVEQSKSWRAKGHSVYATSCMTHLCYSIKVKSIINTYSLKERCLQNQKK